MNISIHKRKLFQKCITRVCQFCAEKILLWKVYYERNFARKFPICPTQPFFLCQKRTTNKFIFYCQNSPFLSLLRVHSSVVEIHRTWIQSQSTPNVLFLFIQNCFFFWISFWQKLGCKKELVCIEEQWSFQVKTSNCQLPRVELGERLSLLGEK